MYEAIKCECVSIDENNTKLWLRSSEIRSKGTLEHPKLANGIHKYGFYS